MHPNEYKSDGCIKDSRHTITIIILIFMVISFLAYLINSQAIKFFLINSQAIKSFIIKIF
jgi:hypothetical protein